MELRYKTGSRNLVIYTELLKCAVLGTCATFSATSPVAQTEKGGAGCSGAKVKNNGAVAVAQKKGANSRPFCAIFKPNFS